MAVKLKITLKKSPIGYDKSQARHGAQPGPEKDAPDRGAGRQRW